MQREEYGGQITYPKTDWIAKSLKERHSNYKKNTIYMNIEVEITKGIHVVPLEKYGDRTKELYRQLCLERYMRSEIDLHGMEAEKFLDLQLAN